MLKSNFRRESSEIFALFRALAYFKCFLKLSQLGLMSPALIRVLLSASFLNSPSLASSLDSTTKKSSPTASPSYSTSTFANPREFSSNTQHQFAEGPLLEVEIIFMQDFGEDGDFSSSSRGAKKKFERKEKANKSKKFFCRDFPPSRLVLIRECKKEENFCSTFCSLPSTLCECFSLSLFCLSFRLKPPREQNFYLRRSTRGRRQRRKRKIRARSVNQKIFFPFILLLPPAFFLQLLFALRG